MVAAIMGGAFRRNDFGRAGHLAAYAASRPITWITGTTLTYWRRLAASDRPNRIFHAVKAARTGALAGTTQAPTNDGPAGGHAANPQLGEERCLFRSTYSVRKIEPKRRAAQ